jgi:site-specific DNA-methyltransferase (adenine-specific)
MKKEALRQWYPQSERIIFAEPAIKGNLFRSPFALFLRQARKKSGLSGNQLTEMIGAYGKVNHGGAVSNWEAGRNTPSREQYQKIREAILSTGKIDNMPPYEDMVRPFVMDKTKEFTDIWTFQSVRPYKGKHPAEKPLELLKHAIEAATYDHDIVIDCFAGSGSTAIAAAELGRKSISVEIDEKWIDVISVRLSRIKNKKVKKSGSFKKMPDPTRQLPLF